MSNIQGTCPNLNNTSQLQSEGDADHQQIVMPDIKLNLDSSQHQHEESNFVLLEEEISSSQSQNISLPQQSNPNEQGIIHYTFEQENDGLYFNYPTLSQQISSQPQSSNQQKKQAYPENNNFSSIHQEFQQPGCDNFKIWLDQKQISSQFSNPLDQNEKGLVINIPQFNLRQYVKQNNIDEDLVMCDYFQSSVYSSEGIYNQFSSDSDDSMQPSGATVISSSSSSSSSSSQSRSSDSQKSSSSSQCEFIPVVDLLSEEMRLMENSKGVKQKKIMVSQESKKDKKRKKRLLKISDKIQSSKKEKQDHPENKVKTIKDGHQLSQDVNIQENQTFKNEPKKKMGFPRMIFENVIQRKKDEELRKKQKNKLDQLSIQINQDQIEKKSPPSCEKRRTGKKQSKKQNKQKLGVIDKGEQITNQLVKPDDISSALNSFKRSSKLQQILMNHHQQKSQLLNCVLFNNFYFQDLTMKIPQASKIPQKFSTIEGHQRIFSSNIRNQLYYEIREKIKQLDQPKQRNFLENEQQNCRGISELFAITIKNQSKVQMDGLVEISAVVQYSREDFRTNKILSDLMQNYRSRYRLFMFVDNYKLNVLCQIRDIQKSKNYDRGQQISLRLVAGVDLRVIQKDQKKSPQMCQDRDYKFENFSAKFYDLEKITTTIRQYQAILNLKYSPLAPQIVDPTLHPEQSQIRINLPTLKVLYNSLQINFNPSQIKAISQISSESQGIQLLQGPPGTGKTSTLIGLLSCQYMKLAHYNEELLKIRKKQKDKMIFKKQNLMEPQEINSMKILICAPSNSAVDLITCKILQNGLYTIKSDLNQQWEGQKRYGRYKFHETSLANIQKIDTEKQKHKTKILPLYRKYPQILRIGISGKQTEGQKQEETQIRNFDLYHIINSIFLNQLKGSRKEITKQQIEEKIKALSTQINALQIGIVKIIHDCEYGQSQDISVNNKFNIMELKRKIAEALTSIIATSGQVLKRMKFSANAFYIKDVIKFVQITIISQAQILLTTLATSYSQKILTANPTFTCLIVDEAAQATEPSVLIPLQFGMKKVVLIGDQCQLPPTVKNPDLIKNQFNRSLFQRIWQCRAKANNQNQPKQGPKNQQDQTQLIIPKDNRFHKLHMLNIQYRMAPKLRQFPSLYFYNGRLKDADMIIRRNMENMRLNAKQVNFIDCMTGKQQKYGNSYINRVEGQCVVAILTHIMRVQLERTILPNQEAILTIGVITPYSEQQKFIRNLLNTKKYQVINSVARKDPQSSSSGTNRVTNLPNVTVSTVDSYQGQQRDIIVISTVRSNSQGNVGFLQDERRINVALTRAKYIVIVIGNSSTLKSSKAWNLYIEWVKANATYLKYSQPKSNDFTPLLRTLFKELPSQKSRWSRQKPKIGQVMLEESDSSS